MKTVIMAGGFGTRAAAIDPSLPKPLLPAEGKPILQWEIAALVRQGFTDIILTVSHMAEKIEAYFGDGRAFGCRISYFREEKPLGNAGALVELLRDGALREDFLLLNADCIFSVDFDRMLRYHREHDALATLLTHPNDHPGDSGLIISKNGVVKRWSTKEENRPEWYKNRVNAGIHIINPKLPEMALAAVQGGGKADLDRDILKPYIHTERIFTYDSPEYVRDMGTPERFRQVCLDLASGLPERKNLKHPQKAVFLDRDGVINRYVGFLTDIDSFELLPGAADAIARINKSGYLAIVVTNQPVIARGELTEAGLDEIHNKMETLLSERGGYLDDIFVCPHHPDKGFPGEVQSLKIKCRCRKPEPGLLLAAAEKYNIDLHASWMVGDEERDILAGKSAGCKTAFVGNPSTSCGQDVSCASLEAFTSWLLGGKHDRAQAE